MSTATLSQAQVDTKGKAPAGDAVKRSKFNSTWQHKPRAEWTFHERLLVDLGILQDPSGSARPPVYSMDHPVPVASFLTQHSWIFPRAAAPLLAHFAFVKATGYSIPAYVAGPLYTFYFLIYGSNLFSMLSRLVKRYGTFDGAHPRDGIPDDETTHVSIELTCVILLRAILAFTFIYPEDQSDMINLKNISMLPVSLFLHAVSIDFWFYWYHRLMHEVDFLWRFHRRHHTTKHPSAAHGAYADHEQEFFDIVGIPSLAYLTLYFTPFRLDFASWWVSIIYVLFIEAGGHSGVRMYFTNPTTYPLRWLGMELCLEDHDLHHRRGWKKASNYGKQTRLWDTIFGSKGERIESHEANLDWSKDIIMK